MYEKIVNYFEEKMCIDNVYFREKHVLWIVGAMDSWCNGYSYC